MNVTELGEELTPRELSALKQIRLTGRVSDQAVIQKFLDDDLIIAEADDRLQLTAKGRQMLVRGSPLLWDLVS